MIEISVSSISEKIFQSGFAQFLIALEEIGRRNNALKSLREGLRVLQRACQCFRAAQEMLLALSSCYLMLIVVVLLDTWLKHCNVCLQYWKEEKNEQFWLLGTLS